jgi:UDP-3-O-[3-hydroxymyristoyl] glucosamine N-acyltransferase
MEPQNIKLGKSMNSDLLNLKDFINERYIINDGFFETVGSAKATTTKNILCYAMNMQYIKIANENPLISIVITLPSLKDKVTKGLVVHDEPDILYGNIVNKLISLNYLEPKINYFIDNSLIIDKSSFISTKCFIGKNVVIGRNVIINDYTIIEDNCIIGDNVVLGCNGFYFKRNKSGELIKFLHAGGVHLHKNVEILTGSMIQRAHDAEFTVINEGTKISVNVNIGHSTIIGKHNMITGNVQVAGRVKIGDCCWIGTSSTISDSVRIGNNVKIKIGSVVVKDVKDNEEVSGNFAYSHIRRIRNFAKEQK